VGRAFCRRDTRPRGVARQPPADEPPPGKRPPDRIRNPGYGRTCPRPALSPSPTLTTPLSSPPPVSLSSHLAGTVDHRTGQFTLAALTACATGLAVLGAAQGPDLARWEAPVSAAVGLAGLYGVWDESATNGFVDPLCAGLVLAAMVRGLLVRPDRRRTPLTLGPVVLAALSKNEGPRSLVVLVAIAVRQVLERGAGERVPWRVFVGVLGLVLAWQAVAHIHGIPSDLRSGSQLVGDAARPLPGSRSFSSSWVTFCLASGSA